MVLDVKVCPEIPRKKSKSVPEANDPVLDRMSESTDRLLRATDQRLAGLEHDARQPHLATEADVKPDTKTCKRAEGL